jgi:hypothetical protein
MQNNYYQSLLGLNTINSEIINADTLTVNKLILPVGAEDGYILTSDAEGVALWKTDPNIVLAGDVSGFMLTNTVDVVGGSSASAVHTGELLSNAATDLNTF